MKEVYLLLRNNQLQGPYTINELKKKQLKPTDLVWIEGKSQAWSYPSEIEELKLAFKDESAKDAQLLHESPASARANEIEERAEELRRKVLSFTPHYFSQKLRSGDDWSANTLRNMAAQRIEFSDHRKREVAAYEWISAVMMTLIVVAGVYGGQKYFFSGNTIVPSTATQTVSTDSHAAKSGKRSVVPLSVTVNEEKMQDSSMVTDSSLVQDSTAIKDSLSMAVTTNKKANEGKKTKRPAAKDTSRIIKQIAAPVNVEAIIPPPVQTLAEEPKPSQLTDSQTKAPITQEPEEKRKGGLFRGLFKKKKKQAEQDTLTVQDKDN